MRLGELLYPGVIKVNLGAEDKFEAIDELVDLLVEAHEIPLSQRDLMAETVKEREREASTGMEHGIALPHGYTERYDDVIAAMGISPQGIPFDTLDGLAAKIIVLLVLPRRSFQGNVKTIAGIAHLMQSATLREALKRAKDPAAALRAIKEEESKATFYDVRARA